MYMDVINLAFFQIAVAWIVAAVIRIFADNPFYYITAIYSKPIIICFFRNKFQCYHITANSFYSCSFIAFQFRNITPGICFQRETYLIFSKVRICYASSIVQPFHSSLINISSGGICISICNSFCASVCVECFYLKSFIGNSIYIIWKAFCLFRCLHQFQTF